MNTSYDPGLVISTAGKNGCIIKTPEGLELNLTRDPVTGNLRVISFTNSGESVAIVPSSSNAFNLLTIKA